MKTPPPIDPAALRTSLEAAYPVEVREMQFIPRGECSWGYRLEAQDGRSYFIKLFRQNASAASSLPGWAARLIYRLHVDGGIEEISYPLPSRSDEVLTNLCGYPAALFYFIEGPTLWQYPAQSKADILYRLGRLLARIHACQDLRADCLRVEQFDIIGREAYDRVIQATKSGITQDGPAGAALSLLRPLRQRLEALREEILAYQEKARRTHSEYYICHGDPTPGNILVRGGTPYLIDWDDIILAPPERDLVFWEKDELFFEGRAVAPVMAGYASITGGYNLNPDIIDFYHRQWTFGEIADYGSRLLFENHSPEQSESDLENLKEELIWLA